MFTSNIPALNKAEREKIIKSFNPAYNGKAYGGIFGLPFNIETSKLILIPVPWDVTVSYGKGTVSGPEAILKASWQIDLYPFIKPDLWKNGIVMEKIPLKLFQKSNELRTIAEKHIDSIESQADASTSQKFKNSVESSSRHYNKVNDRLNVLNNIETKQINAECIELNRIIYNYTKVCINSNRLTGIVGGDHSVILGHIKGLAENFNNFGILHLDAHADLRVAYEGFTYSHASILYNVINEIPSVTKVVSVGIRDYCMDELEFMKEIPNKICWFTDESIRSEIYNGKSFNEIVKEIINSLPENVYVTFDIDVLCPYLCPNTGTPVPGGLEFNETLFILKKLTESGKKIIGFDLCEVGPGKDEWDANVGARVLYTLCNCILNTIND